MGVRYQATCPACNYQETFSIGGSMMDWKLEVALSKFDEEIQKKVIGIINEQKHEASLEIDRCVAKGQCGSEEAMVLVTVVRLVEKSGQVHEYVHCNEELTGDIKIYTEEQLQTEKIKCPKCKNADLAFEKVGFWD